MQMKEVAGRRGTPAVRGAFTTPGRLMSRREENQIRNQGGTKASRTLALEDGEKHLGLKELGKGFKNIGLKKKKKFLWESGDGLFHPLVNLRVM